MKIPIGYIAKITKAVLSDYRVLAGAPSLYCKHAT